MVEKPYRWPDGAKLEEHSKRKHKILREYFSRYLTVRCQLPQQEKFRLAIIEGFAGAGKYICGASGSPLIFIEELKAAVERFNIFRASNGLKPLEIECLLIFNDASPEAIEILKTHAAPLLAEIKQDCSKLHISVKYTSYEFESAYPAVKQLLQNGRFRNVIFNLDQCGHSHVNRTTLIDIMRSYPSAEIFYTFAIESLLAFLRASEPAVLASQLASINLSDADLKISKGE